MQVADIRELVLIIVKIAGHEAYEGAIKCCKNWRAWIKEDIKKDIRTWNDIFNKAMIWDEDGEYWGLPGGVRHGKVYYPTDSEWITKTDYYRDLRHGEMLVKEIIGRTRKITVYKWDMGNLLSSSQFYYDEVFLSMIRGMSVLRYSN